VDYWTVVGVFILKSTIASQLPWKKAGPTHPHLLRGYGRVV